MPWDHKLTTTTGHRKKWMEFHSNTLAVISSLVKEKKNPSSKMDSDTHACTRTHTHTHTHTHTEDSPSGSEVKNLPTVQET